MESAAGRVVGSLGEHVRGLVDGRYHAARCALLDMRHAERDLAFHLGGRVSRRKAGAPLRVGSARRGA